MLEEASLLRLDSQGLVHTKIRQHLTFGHAATYTDSQVFPSCLEMALTASAFSSPLVPCLVQDHPCVSFCTDVLLRLFQCPFDFPPSLLAGPLPDKDEMQANLPAELGALLGLGSAVLCTIALSRNGWSETQAACTLLTLRNQVMSQRSHQERGCDCTELPLKVLKGGRSALGHGYVRDVPDTGEPRLRHSLSGLSFSLRFIQVQILAVNTIMERLT